MSEELKQAAQATPSLTAEQIEATIGYRLPPHSLRLLQDLIAKQPHQQVPPVPVCGNGCACLTQCGDYYAHHGQAAPEPIPMVLHCPKCGMQHIDAPESGDVDDGHVTSYGWDNPPHRSHLCHGCGTIWRPADVPTTGVKVISTKGKADTWEPRLWAASADAASDVRSIYDGMQQSTAQPAPCVPEPVLTALRETQEALGVTQCPWCGHWGQGYADSERPADYCHHEYQLKPWRMFATLTQQAAAPPFWRVALVRSSHNPDKLVPWLCSSREDARYTETHRSFVRWLTPDSSDLIDAMREVIRISDRKHEAWDRAKGLIAQHDEGNMKFGGQST